MSSLRWLLAAFLVAGSARAQWEILPSGSTADLRGIHAIGHGIAWASGTQGTVLRTTDDGKTWQRCATPPDAEHLDFRGIQAFDASTAIVMSSGKGPLSRLYKTTDACQTWTLLFTNPDPEGFWDALFYDEDFDETWILGDPVRGNFRLFISRGDEAKFGMYETGRKLHATPGEAAFAASNSAFSRGGEFGAFGFVTGGTKAEFISETHGLDFKNGPVEDFERSTLPFGNAESSGAFSVATSKPKEPSPLMVAVGGDYKRPEATELTAAYSDDWGGNWKTAQTQPHGYRSAVAYSPTTKTWITVGPNGTDISTDDGRNWRALKPTATEPPDADQHWNALSLPFVVGPRGRIGKLRPDAAKPTPSGEKP